VTAFAWPAFSLMPVTRPKALLDRQTRYRLRRRERGRAACSWRLLFSDDD
jgi:hypothetical protein